MHTTTQNAKPAQADKPCGCGKPCRCANAAPPAQTCCDLVCFERPRYFCGHLLKDEDLSREQRYFREKNKLYHRTLHGHGVVCGLRLTCDPRCDGRIVVGEGFAIDDCGNDLVVCDPLPFDVIGELRRQGKLYETPRPDPCQKEEEKPKDDCVIRNCYYIAACYEEEEAEFTTPFMNGCSTASGACEATRVRERVRIELLDKPPAKASPFDELCRQVQECWKLFTEGEFLQTMQEGGETLGHALSGNAGQWQDDYQTLFCRLRNLLLLHLRRYPEQYSCTLKDDIERLGFSEAASGSDIRQEFCKLFNLAQQYVVGCVLGDVTFPCPEPCAASCVVLGAVAVENGRLVRVTNHPRDYVWSFASFFEVLTAWLFNQIAFERHNRLRGGEERAQDCNELPLKECTDFVNEVLRDPQRLVSRFCAPLNAASKVRGGLYRSFNFSLPDTRENDRFIGESQQDVARMTTEQEFKNFRFVQKPKPPEYELLESIAALGLKDTKQPLKLFTDAKGFVVAVEPELFPAARSDDGERPQLEELFSERQKEMNQKLEEANNEIRSLKEQLNILAKLDSRLTEVEAAVTAPAPKPKSPRNKPK